MPVRLDSWLVPTNPKATPFLLEDTYFRGGMRVIDSFASTALDKLPALARKAGMLVVTADDGKIWKLNSDLATWTEFTPGIVYTGAPPITVQVNGQITIDPAVLVPLGTNAGDVLTLDTQKLPVWKSFSVSGSSGVRSAGTYVATKALAPGDVLDFTLEMSRTVLLLVCTVDAPDLMTQAFATPARDELNPYTFISTVDIMSDQGISILPDSSQFKQRRYSLLANLEEPTTNIIYWRFTNQGTLPLTPTLTYSYLILE